MQIEETKRYKRIQKYAKLGVRLFNMCKTDSSEQIIIGYETMPLSTIVYVNMKIPEKKQECFGFDVLWDETTFSKELSKMTQFIANRLSKPEDVTLADFLRISPKEKTIYQIKGTFEAKPTIKGTWDEVMLGMQEKQLLNVKIWRTKVENDCITIVI